MFKATNPKWIHLRWPNASARFSRQSEPSRPASHDGCTPGFTGTRSQRDYAAGSRQRHTCSASRLFSHERLGKLCRPALRWPMSLHLADPVQTISLKILWGCSGRFSARTLGLRVREFRYHCYYVIAEQVSQGGPALPACVMALERWFLATALAGEALHRSERDVPPSPKKVSG